MSVKLVPASPANCFPDHCNIIPCLLCSNSADQHKVQQALLLGPQCTGVGVSMQGILSFRSKESRGL